MKGIVSEKGQITIPKELRDALGIQSGSEVEFRSERGAIVMFKVVPRDPIDKWRGKGTLSGSPSVDDYLKAVRDEDSD